jgi:hypothetical protein
MFFKKRQSIDSTEQLNNDFGEYPPHPLVNTMQRQLPFYVVHTSLLNKKLYDLILLVRSLRIELDHTNPFLSDISKIKSRFRKQLSDAREQINSFKSEIANSAIHIKIFAVVFITLVLPIFILFAAAFILFNIIQITLQTNFSSNSLGFYIPIPFNGRSEIVANTYRIKHRSSKDTNDGIISHEHIHLLQDHYFSRLDMPYRSYNHFSGKNEIVLKQLLNNPEQKFNDLQYYFQINEMEARLHEVVLSHYRVYRVLPATHHEFTEMILGSHKLGKVVKEIMEREKLDTSVYLTNPYRVRSDSMEIQMAIAIMKLRDTSTSLRFILEALSVMYGNLLFLYGGENESLAFMRTIKSTQLYEELYGSLHP